MIEPSSQSPGTKDSTVLRRARARRAIAAFLLLVIIVGSIASCGQDPTPLPVAAVSPTVADTGQSAAPTSTAPPTPTGMATASATLTLTATPSYTPSLTPSPSATATWTSTPTPAGPTITPTQTITPTSTPTPSPTLTPTPMYSPTPLPAPDYQGNVQHFLLMGLDSTRNLATQNTDVIVVAAVNKDTKQVSMLSVPRDLWVYIPDYGWSRINVAHKIGHRTEYPGGGPGLLAEVLRINLGIPTIDNWARIDFEGFARVVDELGGVEMTVACPVNLRYKRTTSDTEEERILEPGVYQMDGATALRYVRTRRGTNDFDRARRQHQFLRAVWSQFKSPDILLKIPGLWSALSDSFQTDLKLGDVLSLAPIALDLKPQNIRSLYIGINQVENWTNAEGWQVLLPKPDRIQQVVTGLYAPPTASGNQVANEGARIQVRNGTNRAQLAMIAGDQLRWHGFNIVDTGLADNPDYQQTMILVFNEKPTTLEQLIRLLEVQPENVIRQIDPNQPADIQVILGSDYDPCR
jgi:LCP family protein required for cell wall assembly